MPNGAGFCPAGFSAAGWGTNDGAVAPQQTTLIDSITGRGEAARKIDPSTKQYVFEGGKIQGMPHVQQLVMLRANTLRNSSAVRNFGLRNDPKLVTTNLKQQLTTEVNEAYADIVSSGLIQILSVDIIQQSPTQTYRLIKWKDLTTGREHDTRA